jgi:hypothetical protein
MELEFESMFVNFLKMRFFDELLFFIDQRF